MAPDLSTLLANACADLDADELDAWVSVSTDPAELAIIAGAAGLRPETMRTLAEHGRAPVRTAIAVRGDLPADVRAARLRAESAASVLDALLFRPVDTGVLEEITAAGRPVVLDALAGSWPSCGLVVSPVAYARVVAWRLSQSWEVGGADMTLIPLLRNAPAASLATIDAARVVAALTSAESRYAPSLGTVAADQPAWAALWTGLLEAGQARPGVRERILGGVAAVNAAGGQTPWTKEQCAVAASWNVPTHKGTMERLMASPGHRAALDPGWLAVASRGQVEAAWEGIAQAILAEQYSGAARVEAAWAALEENADLGPAWMQEYGLDTAHRMMSPHGFAQALTGKLLADPARLASLLDAVWTRPGWSDDSRAGTYQALAWALATHVEDRLEARAAGEGADAAGCDREAWGAIMYALRPDVLTATGKGGVCNRLMNSPCVAAWPELTNVGAMRAGGWRRGPASNWAAQRFTELAVAQRSGGRANPHAASLVIDTLMGRWTGSLEDLFATAEVLLEERTQERAVYGRAGDAAEREPVRVPVREHPARVRRGH